MQPQLFLSVRGGLANRLAALGAALVWAEQAGACLRLGWPVDRSCGAPFDALFEPPKSVRLQDRAAAWRERRHFAWRRSAGNRYDRLARLFGSRWIDEGDLRARGRMVSADELRKTPRMHVLSQVGFYLHGISAEGCEAMSGARLRALLPDPSVRDRLVPLPPGAVGIHVRQGDHRIARAASPPALFRQRMAQIAAADPSATFYVCSDDVAVEQEFRTAFGSRVVTAGKTAVDRRSVAGVRDALVDLLMLSRCSLVLHGVFSSFGRVAARIGGAPDEWVGDPVVAAQQRLAGLGLYAGPVDGVRSERFELAWDGFQRAAGLDPGRELTFDRLWRLFEDTAADPPA